MRAHAVRPYEGRQTGRSGPPMGRRDGGGTKAVGKEKAPRGPVGRVGMPRESARRRIYGSP
ncbi:MAG: hypothetical protein OJF49_004700 [Ktedonobacterales bacterium]|nr:MAG: hypothetical protein OJF49_004700 [Ktedonobacterales bacterium]